MLPFATVHGQLHGVPVGAVERLVPVQEGLDPIATGRDLAQALDRVSQSLLVDHGLVIGRQGVDVDAEDLLGLRAVVDLEPRLTFVVGGEHHEQSAIDRRLGQVPAEADVDPDRVAGSLTDSLGQFGPGRDADHRQRRPGPMPTFPGPITAIASAGLLA